MADTPEPTSTTLTWAVRVLAAQTVIVAAVAALTIYADLTAESSSLRAALTVTGYVLMMAAIFGLLAWSLHRRRPWARGPAIVLELLLVPIGWYMVSGGWPWLGLPLLLIGLVTAGLLLAPATRAALGISWRPEA
ncbi:hypothetical protein [Luedemannella helvata]|uniref:Integral membrane protein n=1 Tax=Luedemannella helvata TaxID=349315 RepID=A0ABN2L3B6_9ACTN